MDRSRPNTTMFYHSNTIMLYYSNTIRFYYVLDMDRSRPNTIIFYYSNTIILNTIVFHHSNAIMFYHALDLDRSRPVVPPLALGDGLMRLNPELRAAWDNALAKHVAKVQQKFSKVRLRRELP